MSIELKSGRLFIIKQKNEEYQSVRKIEVVELTETTILYRNLDSENKSCIRLEMKKFENEWGVIEDLGYSEQLENLIKNQQ
jgi:hypothetical protein